MNIKVTYNDKTVGVFDEKGMFMLPLARKVSDGYVAFFLNKLRNGETVVYEDEDGAYIEMKKVHYVSK